MTRRCPPPPADTRAGLDALLQDAQTQLHTVNLRIARLQDADSALNFIDAVVRAANAFERNSTVSTLAWLG
jgi:hypothetical protein